MTIEEILKALSDAIAEITDEDAKKAAIETISTSLKPIGFIPEGSVSNLVDSQVAGLKTKNAELIAREKKLKDQVAELTAKGDDFDHFKNVLNDFGIPLDKDGKLDDNELEKFIESKSVDGGEAARNAVNLERTLRRVEREKKELERKITDFSSSLEERAKALSERDSYIESMLIDEALRSSLYKNGFEELQVAYLLPALKEKSKAVVEFDDTTGERKAVTDDGKAVGEWVDWFANTDEGKALKPAPKNHGGGSGGNTGTKGLANKPFIEMTPAERGELFRTDPNKYRQLRDSAR